MKQTVLLCTRIQSLLNFTSYLQEQYKEYEAKWESWREQLLQRREQMRKKKEQKLAEEKVCVSCLIKCDLFSVDV